MDLRSLAPGQTIDCFRLEAPLKPGGMANLWRVTHPDHAMPLVMKLPFVQPGPSIVSAVIALAEQRRKSGEAVLRAVITGYELAGRIPKALGNQNLRRAGVANHGLGPVFGTAAAACA